MAGSIAFIGGASGTGTVKWVSEVDPLPVTGASSGPVAPYQPTPLGYQQVAATSAIVTMTVPATATYAYVSIEGNDARWRDDGTGPTTSVGFPLYTTSAPQLFSGDLAALQFIAQATTTTYNFAYYK